MPKSLFENPGSISERVIRARPARPQPEGVPGRHVEGENAASRDAGAREPDRGSQTDSKEPDTRALADQVLTVLKGRGQTLAVAESLTGGLLCAALTGIPGASAVLRGGVVAYATELKALLLGVPRPLLDRFGAVHPDVAVAMAEGVRHRLGAEFSVATTGVAGPEAQDGQAVGTVHVAVAAEGDSVVRTLALPGDRSEVRCRTVMVSLGLLLGRLKEELD